MKYSEYQNNVFNFVSNKDNKNAVISAVAGSGKTTTIVEAAKRIPKNKKVLFLAFNKVIANELQERLKDYRNIECKTLHSHGLQSLKNVYKFIRVLSCNRFYKLITETNITESNILNADSENTLIYAFNRNCLNLLDKCRINLIKNGDTEQIEKIADMYNIECVADEIQFVNKMLKDVYTFNEKTKAIDFTDMLTLPCQKEFEKYINKYDFIFIDECQDLSKAQRELMLKSLKPNGRFIAVGDRKQAINGFAGASCDSFDLLANIPNTTELPLSVNYRCGKNIIKLAQEIVPDIQYFENSIDGQVNNLTSLNGLKNGDMVLCRITSPLVSLCLDLWKKGIKAYVKGNDIADGLISLIIKQKVKTISALYNRLTIEQENLMKKLEAKNIKNIETSSQFLAFKDKVECIEAIAETCKTNSINELLKKFETLFSDSNDKDKICLSTVHKSKGLEADNVWIILPELLPWKRKNQKDWEYEQEINLQYVAYTRAKKVLNFVNLSKEQLLKELRK